MAKKRHYSEVIYMGSWAGFGPKHCFGQIEPEPSVPYNAALLKMLNPQTTTEWLEYQELLSQELLCLASSNYQGSNRWTTELTAVPCLLDCGDDNCMEWTDVRLLAGNNRHEALRNLVAGKFTGMAYHVSECQMYDDPAESLMDPGERRRQEGLFELSKQSSS